MELRYSQFDLLPRDSVRAILTFLGLGYDPDAFNFDIAEVMEDGEWEGEVKRAATTSDMWAPFFTTRAKEWFKEEAGDALIQAKYTTNKDW